VAASVAVAVLFVALAYLWTNPLTLFLAALSLILPVFVPYFFRDPERAIAEGVASPADGKVMAVEAAGGRLHIAIFMNVHDVHVNRAPLDCTVVSATRAGEGFRLAYEPDSDKNVRLEWALDSKGGRVEMHQITGWFARRIVPYAKAGQRLAKGERFGMIRFGSRVDVWLPGGSYVAAVAVGQRVLAGATTIAREPGRPESSPAAGTGGGR
jgi:phosphatidylserine decarboxylase